jgi:hypothetical protein
MPCVLFGLPGLSSAIQHRPTAATLHPFEEIIVRAPFIVHRPSSIIHHLSCPYPTACPLYLAMTTRL